MVRELPVNGNRAAFVLCEGMCDDLLLSQIAVTPIPVSYTHLDVYKRQL